MLVLATIQYVYIYTKYLLYYFTNEWMVTGVPPKKNIPISYFIFCPPPKDFLGNEVSFQVLPPKNVVLCLFKAGIQTHFLCSINVNHNVKSLNLSENGQKLSSSSRTIVYVKKLYISSTLNIDLILWHTQLFACAGKC